MLLVKCNRLASPDIHLLGSPDDWKFLYQLFLTYEKVPNRVNASTMKCCVPTALFSLYNNSLETFGTVGKQFD